MSVRLAYFLILIMFAASCRQNTGPLKEPATLSEKEFVSVPDSLRPWVYYWWLKGNVSEELITRDLTGMKEKGIGGLLLFDSRGYHDDYVTGNIPVPLDIKHEFMSPSWRRLVKHTVSEAARLGLKVSINLANTGGALRGPWDMEEQGPKELIWSSMKTVGPVKKKVKLVRPNDRKFFRDVAVIGVRIDSDVSHEESFGPWRAVSEKFSADARISGVIDLTANITDDELMIDLPEGSWTIIRFSRHVVGEPGNVDVLNADAVTAYYKLMGAELLKDAGDLAPGTLSYFYNVSWEGTEPDWTDGFESEFRNLNGYDIRPFMPALAGFMVTDSLTTERFRYDYFKTVSHCFKTNCYELIGKYCKEAGIKWHSENGGPWTLTTPMFKNADQLEFWGVNDMPQSEFWCSTLDDTIKTNVRYASMAGNTYGKPVVAVEAFTHMGLHWTKYPAYLKQFADNSLVDGANFFIWHTFTASPPELGKPGFEYFAGTHLNPNLTWWPFAGEFIKYLGRCQYMLQRGVYVADVCCYTGDKNYSRWGRGRQWSPDNNFPKGYKFDMLSTEALIENLTVSNGRLVIPGGPTYSVLIVDPGSHEMKPEALSKISELSNQGATIVIMGNQPRISPSLSYQPAADRKLMKLADRMWHDKAKGFLRASTPGEALAAKGILPDFEGPFEYIHRGTGNEEIYFLSGNGKAECTFRITGMAPELWDPVSGKVSLPRNYTFTEDNRTTVMVDLPESGSIFVVFRNKAGEAPHKASDDIAEITIEKDSININGPWNVEFRPASGKPAFTKTYKKLQLFNNDINKDIKYFSGSAVYSNTFNVNSDVLPYGAKVSLEEVHDIAAVKVNGHDCGILWTSPWSTDITGYLKEGSNTIEIEVINCWANRLIGDAFLDPSERIAKTNVRILKDRKDFPEAWKALTTVDPLMPSGLAGNVQVIFEKQKSSGVVN